MKRKATDEVEGLGALPARRSRIGRLDSNYENLDYDFNDDNIASDDESHYAGTSSTATANNTPLTSLSPARKFPSDLKTIKCTYPNCDKTFNRPARLVAHLRSHNKERPYKCSFPNCDKDYIEEKHLRQHVKGSHTSEREHVCTQPNCGKSFMTATRLRRHQAVHEGQERFRCRGFPPCELSFRKHQTLQRHIRSEHLHMSAFPCDYKDGVSGDVCGAGFDNAGALRRHQEKDHGEIRFWCDECSAQQNSDDEGLQNRVGFTTMALLQAHMKQSHVNCMFCGLQCCGRSDLEEHLESQHSKPNPKPLEERKTVACTWPDCTKTFTKKSNLNVHIRCVHEGLRFVCGNVDLSGAEDLASWALSEGCGESFATKANLENHVRYVHLKYERPEQPQGATKPKQPPQLNLLEELAGVGAKTRRTLPCTIVGCSMKFAHNGELEAHLQSEHIIEQALIEQSGQLLDPMLPQQPVLSMGETMNWEDNGNGEFWIGANDPGMGAPQQGGFDEEWLRDEAEMRRLIHHPYELEGLIDPALDGLQ